MSLADYEAIADRELPYVFIKLDTWAGSAHARCNAVIITPLTKFEAQLVKFLGSVSVNFGHVSKFLVTSALHAAYSWPKASKRATLSTAMVGMIGPS